MASVRIAMLGGGFVANYYMEGLKDVGGTPQYTGRSLHTRAHHAPASR